MVTCNPGSNWFHAWSFVWEVVKITKYCQSIFLKNFASSFLVVVSHYFRLELNQECLLLSLLIILVVSWWSLMTLLNWMGCAGVVQAQAHLIWWFLWYFAWSQVILSLSCCVIWFVLLLWFVSWLIYQKESIHLLFLRFSTSACNTMNAGISTIFMCLTLMIIRYLPPVLTCPRILSMRWQEEVLLKHTNKNNDSFLSLPFLQWQEIKPKPGASWPSARSAFQFASLLDEVCSHAVYLLQSALIARVL